MHLLSTCELYLADNDINGPVLTEVGLLSNTKEFFLSYTVMTGSIPSELALLTKLEFIDLVNNAFGGTIPEELYLGDFDDLLMLDLGGNQFSGTISTNVGQLRMMVFLYFDDNPYLIGTIPSEIGLLERLQKLHVANSGL